MKLHVSSETGILEGVIVHTPGREVSLVNPEMKDELLFDDIIFEGDARLEHLDMLNLFRAAMPDSGRIFEITDLFAEAFKNEAARHYFVEQLIREFSKDNLYLVEDDLHALSAEQLLQFAILGKVDDHSRFSMNPTPNLLFTRDLAAVVGECVILSRAAKKARLRESLLMETLVEYHPMFDEIRKNAVRISGHQSIEGGDVLVASDKLVLIGMSERTSFSGLTQAAAGLMDHGVETVLAVDIPKQRSSMHLDTIFTFAAPGECIIFPPAISEKEDNVVALLKDGDRIVAEPKTSLKSALEEYDNREYTFINCGGDDRTNQFREQWTDGANVFALSPGVIVGYERNTNTFNTLGDHGYDLMNQFEFIEEYGETGFDPSKGQRIAISFQGHELCRGRGGARCMTLPVLRQPQS